RPGATTVVTSAAGTRGVVARRGRTARALAMAPWMLAVAALVGGAWAWRSRPASSRASWMDLTIGDTLPPDTLFPSLAVSPDGGTLLVGETSPNVGLGRLWIKRREQLDAESLTGALGVTYPNFSPDGEWISFVDNNQIKKVRLGEGGETTIADSVNAPFGGHAWLDDGSVVYSGPQLHELSRVPGSG